MIAEPRQYRLRNRKDKLHGWQGLKVRLEPGGWVLRPIWARTCGGQVARWTGSTGVRAGLRQIKSHKPGRTVKKRKEEKRTKQSIESKCLGTAKTASV